jgi:hypothetical protein
VPMGAESRRGRWCAESDEEKKIRKRIWFDVVGCCVGDLCMNGQEESTWWAGLAYGSKFCISYMKKNCYNRKRFSPYLNTV